MDTTKFVETIAQALRTSDSPGLENAEIDIADGETIGVLLDNGEGRFFLNVEAVD